MANDMTGYEKRIKWLEEQVLALQKALESVKHMAGQALEDGARQFQDDSVSRVLFRMQSVGVIAACTGATLGTGTGRFIQVIGGVRYLLQPFASGDVTAPVVNDTGTPTIDNEYLICAFIDGTITALVGDCATASPTRAADPP